MTSQRRFASPPPAPSVDDFFNFMDEGTRLLFHNFPHYNILVTQPPAAPPVTPKDDAPTKPLRRNPPRKARKSTQITQKEMDELLPAEMDKPHVRITYLICTKCHVYMQRDPQKIRFLRGGDAKITMHLCKRCVEHSMGLGPQQFDNQLQEEAYKKRF